VKYKGYADIRGGSLNEGHQMRVGSSSFTVRRYDLHGLSCNFVRPSVTLVDCVHTVRPTIMISSPYGSPLILVSGDIMYTPKIRRGSPRARALNDGGVGTKQILTQNGHSRSFKVNYFGIIEVPLTGYIEQYNKCGLRCEGSEDIASERSENLHFRPPHSHLTPPLQRTPANIRITFTLLETKIPGLHFAADSMGLSSCKF